MKKKQILLALCFIGSCLSMSAQSVLQLHQKDGAVLKYAFSEQPSILPKQESIVVKTEKVQIEYPLARLDYFDFSQSADAIGTVSIDKPLRDVTIYTLSGKLVKTSHAEEGRQTVSTTDLPAGVYIVRNGNTSFKITKH